MGVFYVTLSLAFVCVSLSFKMNKNIASFSTISSSRSRISKSPLNLSVGMPNLVSDITSEKTKFFVDLVANILRRQLVKFDSNDEQTSANSIELYKPEQFLSSSETFSLPEGKKKQFIHIASEEQAQHPSSSYNQVLSKADYAICIPSLVSDDPIKLKHLAQTVSDFMSQLMSAGTSSDLYPLPRNNVNLNAGQWSHFISLTYSSIDEALPNLPELLIGIDAIELRVDLLKDQSFASIHRQIALLRSVTSLPIVFTVRSKGQIGTFSDDNVDTMFALLREGLRAGIEWIDVEACWPETYIQNLCNLAVSDYSATACILGSLHVTTPQSEAQIHALFEKASLFGHADILKVVTGANNEYDCYRIHNVAQTLSKPYIGVCLGPNGSLSRVLNRRFTPVTHPLMATAAPGQLSVKQLTEQRIQRDLITPQSYYLFGTPIQQSLSPAMHNAAFKQLYMPHQYFLNEQTDVSAYKSLLENDERISIPSTPSPTFSTSNVQAQQVQQQPSSTYFTFAGASVTIPHKESIMPYLDETRSPVDIIDAVNTVAVEYTVENKPDYNKSDNQKISTINDITSETYTRKLIGYNTDWLGIMNPIIKKLARTYGTAWSKSDAQSSGRVGLVVGAGGTAKAACYVIQQLGLQLIVTNRDENKGKALANKFNGQFISLQDLSSSSTTLSTTATATPIPSVIISTVPYAANFTLPQALLQKLETDKTRPVIMDVVYKPARTALLQQALDHGYECVQGGSMLVEQGIQQFQLWHHRKAPTSVMKAAVFRDIETLDD